MDDAAVRAARTFRLDLKGAEIRRAFGEAGLLTVLLKGPGLDHLLHGGARVRSYSDVDLLLPVESIPRAQRILVDLGFQRFDQEVPSAQVDGALAEVVEAAGATHGGEWIREDDGISVDLHHTLPQVTAHPTQVWETLQGHVVDLEVAGTTAKVLDPPAAALLIALHAAHHGPLWGSALKDLEDAAAVLPADVWREAALLADAFGARRAMGAGLGLRPQTASIATALGLETTPSRGLQMLWDGDSWGHVVALAFRETSGTVARLRLARHIAIPSAEAMRRGSARARRGRRGLAATYVLRLIQLGRLAPRALGRR